MLTFALLLDWIATFRYYLRYNIIIFCIKTSAVLFFCLFFLSVRFYMNISGLFGCNDTFSFFFSSGLCVTMSGIRISGKEYPTQDIGQNVAIKTTMIMILVRMFREMTKSHLGILESLISVNYLLFLFSIFFFV